MDDRTWFVLYHFLDLSFLVFIVGAKRTPFGAFGGKLKDHTATDLAVVASKAALESSKVQPEWVETVVVGNVIQSNKDAAYLGRHTALRCGVPVPGE